LSATASSTKYEALLARVHDVQDLRKATRVLTWDREVIMPKKGEGDRSSQIATLQKYAHSLYTADETGELIEAAAAEMNSADPQSPRASLIRFLRQDYSRARRLPSEFVSRMAGLNSQATAVWKQARLLADFASFAPWLEKVVDAQREKAELLGYEADPYDALLEHHEPGTNTAEIRAIFEATKKELLPLYAWVREACDSVDDSFLYGKYDIALQQQFARYIAASVSYDFSRGHLGTAVHPFSTNLSLNDVRITTRYFQDHVSPSIFATLHEAGHAAYQQNIDPALAHTPLARESSAGIDESQSRMFENMIGRSLGFWRVHFARLKDLFPDQLGTVAPDRFYRAVNKVQPKFIRVEADELTYNLHIILRFELEQDLVHGRLAARDLPAAWNQKMGDYLGVIPPNDTLGCLQDIHWTLVGLGYFPSYALGNLYAAQFYEAALAQISGLRAELETGKLERLMDWLGEHIHRHGRSRSPAELAVQATGKKLDHGAFIRYATDKFRGLYGA
jgi:carboxypeptidase Taq